MVLDLLLPGTSQVLARWPVTTATAEEQGAPEPLEQAFLPLPRAALPPPLQSHVSFLRTRGEGIYHFQGLSACVSGRLKTRRLLSAAWGSLLCSRQPRGRALRPAVEKGDGEGQDWTVTLRAVTEDSQESGSGQSLPWCVGALCADQGSAEDQEARNLPPNPICPHTDPYYPAQSHLTLTASACSCHQVITNFGLNPACDTAYPALYDLQAYQQFAEQDYEDLSLHGMDRSQRPRNCWYSHSPGQKPPGPDLALFTYHICSMSLRKDHPHDYSALSDQVSLLRNILSKGFYLQGWLPL